MSFLLSTCICLRSNTRKQPLQSYKIRQGKWKCMMKMRGMNMSQWNMLHMMSTQQSQCMFQRRSTHMRLQQNYMRLLGKPPDKKKTQRTNIGMRYTQYK
jgi:NhaP-type Na+/H+ and K+/H+ antiporter